MSDQSAIRLLQTAIENVRETCSGSEYKDLLSACESADECAEKALGEAESSDDSQPKDLKGAAEKARAVMKEQRKNK